MVICVLVSYGMDVFFNPAFNKSSGPLAHTVTQVRRTSRDNGVN